VYGVMYRYSFCEVFSRKILPSIKLYIAYKLVSEYGFTQLEASKILGVKQPLINYLLSGRRKPKHMETILNNVLIRKIAEEIAGEIASSVDRLSRESIGCRVCSAIIMNNIADDLLKTLGYNPGEIYFPSHSI